MHHGYKAWAAARHSAASLNSYLSGLRALEQAYGDLDAAYGKDRFAAMHSSLTYSTDDERHGRPNPSRLNINSHLRKRLSDHRSYLNSYASFHDSGAPETLGETDPCAPEAIEGQHFSMEADLQRALRGSIENLVSGLQIIDGGTEKRVENGFIDILAEDSEGRTVVIELKAVVARRDAVAQCLAYMGDVAAEMGRTPRGILIAPGFDAKAISAASILPELTLKVYRYSFDFSDS